MTGMTVAEGAPATSAAEQHHGTDESRQASGPERPLLVGWAIAGYADLDDPDALSFGWGPAAEADPWGHSAEKVAGAQGEDEPGGDAAGGGGGAGAAGTDEGDGDGGGGVPGEVAGDD